MTALTTFLEPFAKTVRDVLPILSVIAFFQYAILRRPIQNLRKVCLGTIFVLLGLTLFLHGLEMALFPLGETMAQQLTSPDLLGHGAKGQPLAWHAYLWTYVFSFAIGISTTIAEPALIAVAMKAEQISGGTINALRLRIAVALGVGVGVCLASFRIVTGLPLPYFVIGCYGLVIVQTFFAPKAIIPLAFDSGGVTTSTVTVPLVAALGLGLASNIPGRDPLTDGFGVIAFAVLFPIMSVMAYAQLAQWNARRMSAKKSLSSTLTEPRSGPSA